MEFGLCYLNTPQLVKLLKKNPRLHVTKHIVRYNFNGYAIKMKIRVETCMCDNIANVT